MIQVDHLCLSYHGEKLFDEISFTVNPRDRCGFVGRNGSGKSTIFRLLTGLESKDKGTIAIAKGYKLGYLNQHIQFTSPSIVEEACLGLREDERDMVYKAEKMLFGLGFSDMNLEDSPAGLSGGYQMRLHLAKLLLSEPNCLLLDEPTNYLDILSMRFLAKLLQRWESEFILISHDREFMDSVTNQTLGLHRKKMRKTKGSSIDFFNQLVLEEEIYEKTRVNQEKKKAHLQHYIERFGAKATKATQAQSKKKALERIPSLEALNTLYNLDFDFKVRPFVSKKVAEIENVSFSYPDQEEPLIQNFSLSIGKGDRIAIIGKNGYGKSTLLKLISKELKPTSGHVEHADQLAIGYFGQTNIQRLGMNHTVEEEIGLNIQRGYSDIRSICGQMMFPGDAAKKKIEVLSGGERSRVLLGKIIANPCNFLLLDEPTHHLDIESVEALIDALETFPEVFIIVTHSELILKRLELDKLIICHANSQEIFDGTYDEFLEKSGWEEEKTSTKNPKKKEEGKPKPSSSQKNQIESQILKLEEAQAADYEKLALASQKGDSEQIKKLNTAVQKRADEIETLYKQL